MRTVREFTLAEIEQLKKHTPRNTLFVGAPGLGKLALAKELAAAWLHTDMGALDYHPDYLYIASDDGLIRSEQAEQIWRKAQVCPDGEKAVCLVNGTEWTVELQNKLLKVLEDADQILAVIFVATNELLDTVMSRCVTVHFSAIGMDELYAHYQKPNEAALLASDGCPGIYDEILKDTGFSIYLEGFYQTVRSFRERRQVKNLLRLTHSLKEKDREYLPEKLEPWQMTAFLCLLKHLFWQIAIQKNGLPGYQWLPVKNLMECYREAEAMDCYYACAQASEQSKKKGNFTKNDFFDLLIKLIPVN